MFVAAAFDFDALMIEKQKIEVHRMLVQQHLLDKYANESVIFGQGMYCHSIFFF